MSKVRTIDQILAGNIKSARLADKEKSHNEQWEKVFTFFQKRLANTKRDELANSGFTSKIKRNTDGSFNVYVRRY